MLGSLHQNDSALLGVLGFVVDAQEVELSGKKASGFGRGPGRGIN
jgi:hypothetical protein